MEEQQYFPVNWTDGMKINKTHFISQENAINYQLAQNTAGLLNDYNYGLLSDAHKNGNGLKLFLGMDNQQQVQLRVQKCRALTVGGHYIQFEEDTALRGNNLIAPKLQLSVPFAGLKEKATTFFIVISVHPYIRMPFGAADPNEHPPRLPYSVPVTKLSLVPVQGATVNSMGLFQLPVGKVEINEQKAVLLGDYIPPCSSISSHFELLEIHAGLEQFYAKMEILSLQIIQKIFQKKQGNELAAIVQKLCENVLLLTASQIGSIRNVGLHQPPVYLINQVAAIARLIKNTLDLYIGSGKEEFMNYCADTCDINQADLEGAVVNLCNHQYDHLDINAAVQKMMRFTKIVSLLFSNLLRLEYIGKRRDAGIFVKEQAIMQEGESLPKKRRSFLAD